LAPSSAASRARWSSSRSPWSRSSSSEVRPDPAKYPPRVRSLPPPPSVVAVVVAMLSNFILLRVLRTCMAVIFVLTLISVLLLLAFVNVFLFAKAISPRSPPCRPSLKPPKASRCPPPLHAASSFLLLSTAGGDARRQRRHQRGHRRAARPRFEGQHLSSDRGGRLHHRRRLGPGDDPRQPSPQPQPDPSPITHHPSPAPASHLLALSPQPLIQVATNADLFEAVAESDLEHLQLVGRCRPHRPSTAPPRPLGPSEGPGRSTPPRSAASAARRLAVA
jgi:hypothetical protein